MKFPLISLILPSKNKNKKTKRSISDADKTQGNEAPERSDNESQYSILHLLQQNNQHRNFEN